MKPKISGIDFYEYLNNEAAMNKVSVGFAKRSNGIFKAVMGALDDWQVRITCPSYWKDGVKNITFFFQEKGYMP